MLFSLFAYRLSVCLVYFFFLMIRRPPRSTLFPTRRSSDLSARSTPCASAGSEVVLEAGCPQHVGAEPAAVQREQRVGHQRDPRAGRELEAERAVDHVIALVGEVRDIDRPPERRIIGHGAGQLQLALADLQL